MRLAVLEGLVTHVTRRGSSLAAAACAAARQGKELGDEGTVGEKVTGLGYKQVYGSANVWGDGITPVPVGSLEGAECVELEGVYHSPLGAAESRPWYGTEGVLEQWADYLEPPRRAKAKPARKKILGLF